MQTVKKAHANIFNQMLACAFLAINGPSCFIRGRRVIHAI